MMLREIVHRYICLIRLKVLFVNNIYQGFGFTTCILRYQSRNFNQEILQQNNNIAQHSATMFIMN